MLSSLTSKSSRGLLIKGKSFTGSTSNIKISLSESSPSLTATEISTSPKKSAAGVTVRILSVISPEASPETIVSKYVRASPSTSLADNVYVNMSSSLILCEPTLLSTGASLTGSTLIVTVAVLDVNAPSVTRYVNVVLPLKSSSGVKFAIDPVI